jgi:transcriptional regulator with XRE-family HTH domain
MKQNFSPEIALGQIIRRERLAKNMSQEELAFESNLHRTYIGSVERGERNISLRNIISIARALRLPAAYLLAEAKL